MTSLAAFVIDTVAGLRRELTGEDGIAGLPDLIVKEVTLSFAYDPGPDGKPIILPGSGGGIPRMGLGPAEDYLFRNDRQVQLQLTKLSTAPPERLARFELTIDLVTAER